MLELDTLLENPTSTSLNRLSDKGERCVGMGEWVVLLFKLLAGFLHHRPHDGTEFLLLVRLNRLKRLGSISECEVVYTLRKFLHFGLAVQQGGLSQLPPDYFYDYVIKDTASVHWQDSRTHKSTLFSEDPEEVYLLRPMPTVAELWKLMYAYASRYFSRLCNSFVVDDLWDFLWTHKELRSSHIVGVNCGRYQGFEALFARNARMVPTEGLYAEATPPPTSFEVIPVSVQDFVVDIITGDNGNIQVTNTVLLGATGSVEKKTAWADSMPDFTYLAETVKMAEPIEIIPRYHATCPGRPASAQGGELVGNVALHKTPSTRPTQKVASQKTSSRFTLPTGIPYSGSPHAPPPHQEVQLSELLGEPSPFTSTPSPEVDSGSSSSEGETSGEEVEGMSLPRVLERLRALEVLFGTFDQLLAGVNFEDDLPVWALEPLVSALLRHIASAPDVKSIRGAISSDSRIMGPIRPDSYLSYWRLIQTHGKVSNRFLVLLPLLYAPMPSWSPVALREHRAVYLAKAWTSLHDIHHVREAKRREAAERAFEDALRQLEHGEVTLAYLVGDDTGRLREWSQSRMAGYRETVPAAPSWRELLKALAEMRARLVLQRLGHLDKMDSRRWAEDVVTDDNEEVEDIPYAASRPDKQEMRVIQYLATAGNMTTPSGTAMLEARSQLGL